MAALANTSTELLPGQCLDRYELVYPVARGGMARVWVAKLRGKHGFEKMVALKTILPTFADDPRFRRMFLDEAKIASGIEHVNVAQILDLGEQSGQLYLVMEWVDGDSLQELDRAAERAGVGLPIPVIVRVIADVCAGLHAAHELADARGRSLNVVHRDISPQNVLISAKGGVKVIDFGVMKARYRTTEETSTGTIKGKLQYMAPEQALGHAVDRRADIWAVGATLYRLLAHRPVFGGDSPLSTFKRLTSATPPAPLPAHVPIALSSIVLKALAFEPDRRYATAAELGAALEALLHGPYQTTSREVAATMEQYLGDSLATRRAAILEALGGERPTPAGGSPSMAPTGADWESGVSQAKTLPRNSLPSQPPTVPDLPSPRDAVLSEAASEDDTRRLNTAPPAAEREREVEDEPRPTLARWAAAGGVLSLVVALVWAFASPSAPPAPKPVKAPPASAPTLAMTIEPPVVPLTALPASEPEPAAPEARVEPKAPAPEEPAADATPLSVQALPVLKEKTAKPVKHRPAVVAKPAAAPAVVKPAAAPAVKPAPAAAPAPAVAPKRKVVDDGF